jgi:hypothetical protein
MTTIPELSSTLQTLLTDTANQLARTTGFIQRQRQVTGAGFAQAVVFGFMANPAATRHELHQAAALSGMNLSTPGLDKRFTAKAAYFLESLLAQALAHVVQGVPQTASLLSRFNGVYIGDSTIIGLPSPLAGVFRGNNGEQDAAAKVAVQWEIKSGGMKLWLSDAVVHDQRTGLVADPLPQGALRLNDLGFFNLTVFEQDIQQGRYFLSRYKSGTLVYTPQGQSLNLVKTLKQQARRAVSLPIQLGNQRLACRLIALPVAAEKVGKRRQQLRKRAKRKQQPVSPTTLALAAWTLYVTNLSEAQLSIKEAVTLGATRWQIECLFKLWKQSGLLDETRSQNAQRVWCEFYAKLLAVLVQHWIMLVGCWHRWERSLHQAFQVIRKQAFALLTTLRHEPALRAMLEQTARVLSMTCRLSKRATHPLTFQRWLEGGYG